MVEALAGDWRSAEVGDRLRAILAFAERLTLDPADVGDGDVARLREAGLDDEGVLHVVEIVSYFNFVNRMADGLGVRLEEAWPHPPVGEPDELHGGGGARDEDG